MTTVRQLTNKDARPEWPDYRGKAGARPLAYLHRLFATWRAALDSLAPIGYQDESGFHYGEPRRQINQSEATAS